MTVKTRITLFIAGAGFIASLLFSVVVFSELIEQPFHLLDAVLEEEANHSVAKLIQQKQSGAESPSMGIASYSKYVYWTEVYDEETGLLCYQSDLAKLVTLSRIAPGTHAITTLKIPPGTTNIGQDLHGNLVFRVRAFRIETKGKTFIVQTARPIERLQEEIQDLILGTLSGLVFSTLVLIVISWFVAGRILHPIGTMRDLARDISEKNLDHRIPAGEGKDEFSELAKTINKMLDRLQYSFSRQREFLFATSHELKTPLTTLRLAADEISRCDPEMLPSCARDNLPRLSDQVLRMERLVKDLLSLSSLEAMTRVDEGAVQINELLMSLVEEYQFMAYAHNIKMDSALEGSLVISGDAEKLRRAFSNILDNAVKYNMDGGRVEVTGEMIDDEVRVAVANTGPGVAADEVPKVFDQFFRAEKSRSSSHGGSGLGLAIVKRVIELHHGTVAFESREGDLTRVTVVLPGFRETDSERENRNLPQHT